MKILGIDTTTRFLSLGLCDNARIYAYSLEVGSRLSSLLALTIKRVLDTLGWRIKDIDYFACGIGPGSFTGMRVGISTIQGLAWSLNKPVVGLSTLDILAGNAGISDAPIIPAIDAKRNMLYCSVYKNKDGTLRRLKPYMLLTLDEFLQMAHGCVILGDAAGLYKEKFLLNIRGVRILDKDYWYPKARNIIALASERIKDKGFQGALEIKPIYLYPKECQIRCAK